MGVSPYKNIEFSGAVQLVKNRLDAYKANRINRTDKTPAAVLILLLNKNEKPYLLFTRRTELVEHHKGQISFPGGMQDPPDNSLLDTAVRETEEEIGIQSQEVEVLGYLDDFFTVTNFIITPFVGILKAPLQFRVNHDEVAEVIQVPLSLFLCDDHFEVKKWEHQGRKYDVYFYDYNHHVIWGATAYILNRFIEIVFDYNPAPHPVDRDPRNAHYLKENMVRGSSR